MISRKLFFTSIALLFAGNYFAQAQDTLYFKDESKKAAKILEISEQEISYKLFDYQDGPTFKFEKKQLVKIKFANGLVENYASVVTQEPKTEVAEAGSDPTSKMSYKNIPIKDLTYLDGLQDAKQFYRGYKGAGTGSFFAGLFVIYGLPVPIITSISAPQNVHQFVPDNELYRLNPAYAAGFNDKAKKMKAGKAWGNFGIGAGVTVGLSFAILIATIASFGTL